MPTANSVPSAVLISLPFSPITTILPPRSTIALVTPSDSRYSATLSAIYPFAIAPRSILVLGFFKETVFLFQKI